MCTVQSAAQAAHTRYAARAAVELPPDSVTDQLQPGSLAMVLRPRTSKLLTRNAGPFLVTRLEPPHVRLRSLTHAVELKENVKNVRPLHLMLSAADLARDRGASS